MNLPTILVAVGLMELQLLLALPWLSLAFLTPADVEELKQKRLGHWFVQRLLVAAAALGVLPLVLLFVVQDRESLEIVGRFYASVLQVQLTVDVFIVGFFVLLRLWPKGGAVALAAFREGVRQWMFWLLVVAAALAMLLSIIIPYFTFGEDYLMVKQIGYDLILLAAVLFGALAATLSISEEIEGRTAITVMSKPVSRRQFMLGKYFGIILAALFLFGILGVFFEGVLFFKHWWEKLESISQEASRLDVAQAEIQSRIGVVVTPLWVYDTLASLERLGLSSQLRDVLRGVGQWTAHTLDTIPGLILYFSQVMVLVGLAVALATRLPMVVNLTVVVSVYVLAHLTPVLLKVAQARRAADPGSTVSRLVGFVAGLFDTVLPHLSSFKVDPALVSDAPPPPMAFAQYVGSVTLYGVVYAAIMLLLGLILFEDRDLA